MKLSKLLRLLLTGTALALTSQVAQATVVNLNSGGPLTDIGCKNLDLDATYVQNCWLASQQGAPGPDNTSILDAYEGLLPVGNPKPAVPGFDRDNLLYKAEAGIPVTEVGDLASSYETTFTNNNEFATISHVEGQASVDCSVSCFLLVKDGGTPFAYLFMLSLGWDDQRLSGGGAPQPWATAGGGPSWDGIEDLELKNFWNSEGGITYAALYSADVSEVPVPAAFWLFGTALMCFIGLSRSTRV